MLRSIWFDNERVAASRLPSEDLCAGCSAPCEKACGQDVPVKKVMQKLHSERDGGMQLEASDYERLKTNICGIPLENPFLLSSSVVGSTYDMCARAFDAGWAGVAFKTVSMMDIHEASPRFSAIKGDSGIIIGFKNIEQLSDHSVVENMEIFRRLKKEYPNKFLLASIMGRDDDEWTYLAQEVTKAGADAIELNFSCPNMVEEGTGADVGQLPHLIERFTAAARKGSSLPILAKLTPNVGTMSEGAEAAVKGGADGVAAINTIKSLIEVSPDTKKAAVGGFYGNSVKPIALRFISELGKNEQLKEKHISGMGGIETWRDAMEFMMLGADSIQITTAVMQYGYRIIDGLKDGLALFLKRIDSDAESMAGMGIKTVVDVEQIERDIVIYPKFIRNSCAGCGRCYISCMDGGHQAITFGEKRQPVLEPKKCVGCHLCVLVCPHEAIVSSGIVTKKSLE